MEKISFRATPLATLNHLFSTEMPLTRLVAAVTPFLDLYKPIQPAARCFSGAIQVISIAQNDDSKKKKIFQTSLCVTFVYLSIYHPKQALVIAVTLQTYRDVRLGNIRAIFSRFVQLLAPCLDSLEFTIFAFALELEEELEKAYSEYKRKRYLEGFATCLIGGVRTYQIRGKMGKVARRYLGKKVNQLVWNDLQKKEDLAGALREGNYSDKIQGIRVNLPWSGNPHKFSFEDLIFENVSFSGSIKFPVHKVTFTGCDMKNIFFHRAHLTDVVWKNSQLKRGIFYRCFGFNLYFNKCNLTDLCMSDSSFSRVVVERSSLYGASFLYTIFDQSTLIGCDLANVLLCGANFARRRCTENIITRPVIALSWFFEALGSWGALIPIVLEDQKALTLRFPTFPRAVDAKALHDEVRRGARLETKGVAVPPRSLLHSSIHSPEITKTVAIAKKVMSYADGAILSGGKDIEQAFYSKKIDGLDYRRSVLEFAIIDQGKPVLGICRGSQLINVYFGGTLKNVPLQQGIYPLEWNSSDLLGKELQERVGGVINGYSAHHQAVDRIGTDLHVTLKQEGMVKAFKNATGTILGTQFHPERYIGGRESLKNNKVFFKDFLQAAAGASRVDSNLQPSGCALEG